MRDTPDAADLIATARDALIKEILPVLPAEQRLTGLMIANALGIAGREAVDTEAARDAWHEALMAIYGDRPDGIAAVTTRLAADIRAGAFDGDRGAQVHAALLADAERRVRVANPRYLERD